MHTGPDRLGGTAWNAFTANPMLQRANTNKNNNNILYSSQQEIKDNDGTDLRKCTHLYDETRVMLSCPLSLRLL